MANLVKAIGQDMLHETLQKFDRRDCFRAVSLGAKEDVFIGNIEQSAIRNADTMRVPSEVFEDVFSFAEGGLCIDDPGQLP